MSQLQAGERIGSYRVVRQIGAGGMGAVYEAVHEQIRRRAAIKLLRGEHAADPELVTRFLNEARAVNIIGHQGLVSIYEMGRLHGGAPYIVMEYLEGQSLAQRLPGIRRQTGAEVLRLFRQIASALIAAHERGIIHRDLKPDNVMVVPDSEMPGGERIKVLDFGIAKMGHHGDGGDTTGLLTRSGVLMGTPRYMSPEQCRGAGEVDERTDVYSLGVMLYEVLAGRPPFSGKGPGDLILKHLSEVPAPLGQQNDAVPPALAALVHEMLRKERTERPWMWQVAAQLSGMIAQDPATIGGPAPHHKMGSAGTAVSPEARARRTERLRTARTGRLWAGRTRRLWAGLAAGCLAVVLGAVYAGVWRERGHPPAVAAERPAPAAPALGVSERPAPATPALGVSERPAPAAPAPAQGAAPAPAHATAPAPVPAPRRVRSPQRSQTNPSTTRSLTHDPFPVVPIVK